MTLASLVFCKILHRHAWAPGECLCVKTCTRCPKTEGFAQWADWGLAQQGRGRLEVCDGCKQAKRIDINKQELQKRLDEEVREVQDRAAPAPQLAVPAIFPNYSNWTTAPVAGWSYNNTGNLVFTSGAGPGTTYSGVGLAQLLRADKLV